MTTPEATLMRLTADDVAEVVAIEHLVRPSGWSQQVFTEELERADRTYLGLRRDGRVVGFAGMWLAPDAAHITKMATHPDHRRQGIARTLLKALLDRAVAAGFADATLEVGVDNTAARGLYDSFGFVPAGVRPGYYAHSGEDALIMWVHGLGGP